MDGVTSGSEPIYLHNATPKQMLGKLAEAGKESVSESLKAVAGKVGGFASKIQSLGKALAKPLTSIGKTLGDSATSVGKVAFRIGIKAAPIILLAAGIGCCVAGAFFPPALIPALVVGVALMATAAYVQEEKDKFEGKEKARERVNNIGSEQNYKHESQKIGEHITDLVGKIDTLKLQQAELDKKKKELDEHQKEINAPLHKKLEEIETKLEECNSESVKIQKERESAEKEISGLNELLKTYAQKNQTDYNNTRKVDPTIQNKIVLADNSLQGYKSQMKELEKKSLENDAQKNQLEETKKSIENVQQQLAAVYAGEETEENSDAVIALDGSLETNEQKLEAALNALKDLNVIDDSQISHIKKEISEIKPKVAEYHAQPSENEELNQLETQLKEKTEELDELNDSHPHAVNEQLKSGKLNQNESEMAINKKYVYIRNKIESDPNISAKKKALELKYMEKLKEKEMHALEAKATGIEKPLGPEDADEEGKEDL